MVNYLRTLSKKNMSAAASNLNHLLRLLKDDLPADVADRLRERLREDAELAQKYQTLLELTEQVWNVDTLPEDDETSDPAEIAEFVEGGMTSAQQVAFEHRCWSSDGLLREVVAAWNAMREATLDEPDDESLAKARSVVQDLFAAFPPLPSEGTQEQPAEKRYSLPKATPLPGAPAAADRNGTAPAAADRNGTAPAAADRNGTAPAAADRNGSAPAAADRNGSAPAAADRNGTVVVSRRSHRKGRRSKRYVSGAWLVAGGVLVVILVLAIRMFTQTSSDSMAQPDRDLAPVVPDSQRPPSLVDDDTVPREVPEEVLPQTAPQQPNQGSLVQDDDSTGTSEPLSPQRERPRDDPNLATQNPVPRDTVPDTRPNNQPDQNSPQVPPVPRPTVSLVAWSEISGIVGDKRADGDLWSGIHGRSVADLWHSRVRSQLVTMPDSRAAGNMTGGLQIIADGDSLIEVGAVENDGSTATVSEGTMITPLLAVQRGRLAIDGLRSGQRIQVEVAAQRIEIQATVDDSTLAIEHLNGETVVAAYRGRLRSGNQSFTRRSWGRVGAAGTMKSFRPQQLDDWYRQQPKSSIPAKMCDAFNAAPDLVQLATSMEASRDTAESKIAVQVALRCLVSNGKPITAAFAGRLLNSRKSEQGEALIEWLVTRYRQSVRGGQNDLSVICRTAQIPRKTNTEMSGWFQTAVSGQRPTKTQLAELLTHLRNTSPVFTRRCSKYFLQHILSDPLPEYDPATASARGLSAVSRKVRNWERANP